MPHYQFTVKDKAGVEAELAGRCGNFGFPWGGTDWPVDYVIDLAPGESHDEIVNLPQAITQDGEYYISFNYVFTAKANETTPGGPYPDRLWHGAANSDPVLMTLKAQ